MENKKCGKCLEVKSLNEFYKADKNNFQSYCKACNKNLYKSFSSNCLYKITSNDKIIYIGITESFNQREIQHKSKLRRHKTFNGSKLANEVNLDEINNWKWEIIMEDSNYTNLKIKELELIVEHKPRFNSPYREFYEQNLVF
jgi:predicted GIY-YIG superfamily endonuclease